MLNSNIIKICQGNPDIRKLKIKSIEHAIDQAEILIKESNMNEDDLIFLKRKVSSSRQLLELLYLIKD